MLSRNLSLFLSFPLPSLCLSLSCFLEFALLQIHGVVSPATQQHFAALKHFPCAVYRRRMQNENCTFRGKLIIFHIKTVVVCNLCRANKCLIAIACMVCRCQRWLKHHYKSQVGLQLPIKSINTCSNIVLTLYKLPKQCCCKGYSVLD